MAHLTPIKILLPKCLIQFNFSMSSEFPNTINKFRMYNKALYIVVVSCFLLSFNSCKPEDTAQPKETGTVTDIDGNIYQTVKIGNQWWMSENLLVTRYNDSSHVTQLNVVFNPDTAWANSTTEAYCSYENNLSLIHI